MPRFEGRFHESFPVRLPAEPAAAWFADPRQVVAQYGSLESHELLDPQTVRLVLPEYSYGVAKFRGRYTCRYALDGPTTVRWHTLGDESGTNVHSTGTARFTPRPDGTCTLDYEASLALDIAVPSLLRRVIAPIVAQSISREMRAYVLRMTAAAESS